MIRIGANYVSCIQPNQEARKRGHQQNLWLFGKEGYVTEVGAMNFFVVWVGTSGKRELITPPLDGTILNGFTRDSILTLARERLDPSEWTVREERFTINELFKSSEEGRLLEAFGSGTAAVVSPIKAIEFNHKTLQVPLQKGKEAGSMAEMFDKWIREIQLGIDPSPWSVVL